MLSRLWIFSRELVTSFFRSAEVIKKRNNIKLVILRMSGVWNGNDKFHTASVILKINFNLNKSFKQTNK